MRIVSVHLKNIKSHRDREIVFSPGINVLSGANGSGKSTVFEAIGYALFGVSAQDFVTRAERFLTIGAKKGEVSVVFEPIGGEMYRVTRTVGSAGKWLLAKERDGEFEVEEHANAQETEARIASLLGLASGRPLADQFKLVIGPFQNDFLGPFVIRQPTRRQEAFDEILGIDAWRKTFEGTKALTSTIAGKIETLLAEVAGKQEQVAVLPAKEEELRVASQTAAVKRQDLSLASAAMEEVSARIAALDAQKEQLEAAQSAVLGLQERVSSGRDHIASQQLLVRQSQEAAQVLEAARPGKLAYDAAELRLKGLRDRQQEKSLLEKELAALEKEQSGISATLAIETRELEQSTAAIVADASLLETEEQGQAAALAKLKQEEAALRSALEAANLSLARFRQLKVHRIENVLPHLQVTLERIAASDAQLAKRGELLAAAGPLRAQAAELPARQAELEKIQQERSQLAGRKHSLIEGRDMIGNGACPFFQEPCRNLGDGGGEEVFLSRIDGLDAEMARLDRLALSLTASVSKTQEAVLELAGVEKLARELEPVQRDREGLEKDFAARLREIAPAEILKEVEEFVAAADLQGFTFKRVQPALDGSTQERHGELQRWSDSWHGVIGSLDDALTASLKRAEEPVQACALRLAELGGRLEALEGRKRELLANREKALKRQQSVAAHRARLSEVGEAAGRKKEALSEYLGLEDRIRDAGEELTRYQGDRDRFIAHQQAAEELDKRRDMLEKYQERLRLREAELAAKLEEQRTIQEGYLPELHAEAKGERERLVSALATLQAELVSLSEAMARLEGEIAQLTELAAEIGLKLAQIEKLRDQGNLVKFLRNQVFKNVSVQLSERFREEISFRADRIYRSISESDEELFWGENYQIVLKDMADGAVRERSDDQLSGGQMMSAVVALRLALLQTIGARVAFFDEPTSNLDAERRENLARAFRAIDTGQEEVTEHWYDQLFLVSHDVSFTEITDQTIQMDT